MDWQKRILNVDFEVFNWVDIQTYVGMYYVLFITVYSILWFNDFTNIMKSNPHHEVDRFTCI